MYMFHRKLISIEEYEAGSRYRLMCELQGGGTGNVLKERIDNSNKDFITSSLGAALAVKDVDDEIGKRLSVIMKLFCHFNFGIIEIAYHLGMSERRASNNVHEGLSSLAIYYGYKKVHNTIRGQGKKDFWIKLDIDAIEICRRFYDHYHNMWKNKNFFYDDSMLWRTVYDELVPKIQNNIDFLLQPK
jgi:hypothetical protein